MNYRVYGFIMTLFSLSLLASEEKPKASITAKIIMPEETPQHPSRGIPNRALPLPTPPVTSPRSKPRPKLGRVTRTEAARQNPPQVNAFFSALAKNDPKEVARLLKEDKNLANAKNENGWTALMKACQTPSIKQEIVSMLIDAGANVNEESNGGATALREAVVGGNDQVIKVLIRHGANPNAIGAENITPLMLAASQGHEKAVHQLLDLGAKPNIVTFGNQTALDWVDFGVASKEVKDAIKKRLRQYGAKTGQELEQEAKK